METFYEITIAREREEILIQSINDYDQISLRRGEITPAEPFEMVIGEGSNLYDVIGFQDTSNFAISEKLYNLLVEYKVTGWKGYEVTIRGVSGKYFGFQVIGRCGKLNQPQTAGFYTGYKFDDSSWDKSDLFCPDETVLLFCTEKVKTLFKKNRVSNVAVIEISKAQAYSFGID